MLPCQKHLFSISPDVNYLNCAYMSPLLKSVEQSGIKGIRFKRDPSQLEVHDFFEPVDELRKLFAQLVDVRESARISVIPSVSYGMANAAKNVQLSRGDEVIMVGSQFPSNYYVWQIKARKNKGVVKIIEPPENSSERAKQWNTNLLNAIGKKTKVVTIPIYHWADGTRFDIKKIREKTHKYGAILVLDGTQSIGAVPFSVHDLQPDALICAGYKFLMGPYSIGLAYYGPRFDHGDAIEESWMNRKNSQEFSKLVDYQEEHRPLSRRYEVGESSNFILIPMLKEALSQILKWELEKIKNYCDQITEHSIERLRQQGFLIEESIWRGSHLFGIRFPKPINIEKVRQSLKEEKIFVSVRGDSIRVSPHVYNQIKDLEQLEELLIHIRQSGEPISPKSV